MPDNSEAAIKPDNRSSEFSLFLQVADVFEGSAIVIAALRPLLFSARVYKNHKHKIDCVEMQPVLANQLLKRKSNSSLLKCRKLDDRLRPRNAKKAKNCCGEWVITLLESTPTSSSNEDTRSKPLAHIYAEMRIATGSNKRTFRFSNFCDLVTIGQRCQHGYWASA